VSRRKLLLLIQVLLGLGMLAAWAVIVDLPAVGQALSRARWGYVCLAALIWLASGVLRAFRWRIVLGVVAWLPIFDLWLINAASALVNFLIPLRTAELAKSLLLKQRHRIPIASSLTSAAFDRVFDLLAVVGLGFGGALLGASVSSELSVVLMAGAGLFLAFVLLMALAVAARKRLPALIERILPARLGAKLRAAVLGGVEQVLGVLGMLGRNPKDAVPLLGLSIAAALLDTTSLMCFFAALQGSPSFLLVLTGYALFTLTFLIPSAPGYVGSMEALGLLVFGTLGVDHELAASVIVLNHAVAAILLGITGGLAMSALGVKPREAVQALRSGETVPQPVQTAIDS
jgi:uncharacterized protein (TIRG00374 family)